MEIPSYDDFYELVDAIKVLNKKVNYLLEKDNCKVYSTGGTIFNNYEDAADSAKRIMEEYNKQFAGATGGFFASVNENYNIGNEVLPKEIVINI